MKTTVLTIAGRAQAPARIDVARLARDCEQLAAGTFRLEGSGAAAVRMAARKLLSAVQDYQQERRRLGAELLRVDPEEKEPHSD